MFEEEKQKIEYMKEYKTKKKYVWRRQTKKIHEKI